MKKKGIKKKLVKKTIKNPIIKNKLLIGIIGLIIIIVIISLIFIKTNIPKELNTSQDKIEKDIKASFEWRDPKTITPYGGRFYDKCDDGTNLGKIWANIELQNSEKELSFTCKTTIIVKDTQKIVDAFQISLGTNRIKSGFIGFTEELAKEHLIEVCCKSKTEGTSFCKTFEFAAYC
jgi:hypothetical protein